MHKRFTAMHKSCTTINITAIHKSCTAIHKRSEGFNSVSNECSTVACS